MAWLASLNRCICSAILGQYGSVKMRMQEREKRGVFVIWAEKRKDTIVENPQDIYKYNI